MIVISTSANAATAVKHTDFTDMALSYLHTRFPEENISILVADSYTTFETGTNYTIIKAFHDNKPTTIAINHANKKADRVGIIEDEYNEYLNSMPKPYRKMDRSLRMAVKEKFEGLPRYEDLVKSDTLVTEPPSNLTFPTVFTASNTRDLVEIAKLVNSRYGFPEVYNGKGIKYVSIDLPLPIILKVLDLNATKRGWLNHKLGLNLDNSVPAINGDDVRDNIGLDGSGIKVSVIDSGVNSDHPALTTVTLRENFAGMDDVNDHANHGTPVACIIASNDSTYKGMAPSAEIFSARTGGNPLHGPPTFEARVILAMDWSIEHGANILSLSQAKDRFTPYGIFNPTDGRSWLTKYIDQRIYIDNITMVVITGNKEFIFNQFGNILVPGDTYNGITTGATDETFNKVIGSSGHGLTDSPQRTKVDVVAPGENIHSCNADWATEDDFDLHSGTSFAAPHVSGLAALLHQYLRDNNRTVNPLLIKAAIINSAKKIKDISGAEWSHLSQRPLDTDQGAGRINALEAYKTLNDSGRVYMGKVNTNNPAYYYINISDAPTNLTVTLTWNRHVTDADSDPPPLNDLDLRLFDSSETQVNESNSIYDNVEHIHYGITNNGLYNIEVYPYDVSGNEPYAIASSHKMTVKQNISLVNGCNLISIPKEVDDWNVSKVLSSIYGKYEIVWMYNASDDNWRVYSPGPAPDNLKFMNPVFGYWVTVNVTSTNLEIEGTNFNPTNITLVNGWNLIGYPYAETQEISSALSSIDGKYSVVWEYNASDTSDPWKLYYPTDSVDTIHYMKPGVGYWIKATEATTLYLYGR